MSERLLFITSHYFMQPTVDALSRLSPPCETLVVPYDNFSHISQVYRQYADQFDACFTSGVIAKQAIEMGCPHIQKPLIAFQISPNALHRDILRFVVETQNFDFNRIVMDFLLPLEHGYSVNDFLKMDTIDGVYAENAHHTRQIGAIDGHSIESVVLNKIIGLWEENAIDLVICQYSSIIPALQERGIPYRCSFVSDQHLGSMIQDVLTKLELQKLYDNHPVIIQIFSRDSVAMSADQYQALRRCVHAFMQENLMESVIQDLENCCVVITSVQILRFLTNEFQNCLLSAYLSRQLDFPVLVSYGIGSSVSHAMNNVQIASKEAKLMGSPFIVDSKGSLIGPLNSENRIVFSFNAMPDISQIGKRCSLSTLTVQKIITILKNAKSDKITTQDLAARLDTTVRNANRIMTNLCKGGVAKPVYTQPTHARGRPVQVFVLDFGFPLM